MITSAKIINYDGKYLKLKPSDNISRKLEQMQSKTVEIRLVDGRTISAMQRKKIYALLNDISIWSGYEPEWLKNYLKYLFCYERDLDFFSLSDCEKSIATEFISYLVHFCMYHNIGTKNTLLNLTDDIEKYLYYCLENRKCAICNIRGEVHHVDRVGMGFDREQIVHVGLRAICLCRTHHIDAHQDERKLFEKHHIYGIKLDEYLCKKLNLRTKSCKQGN